MTAALLDPATVSEFRAQGVTVIRGSFRDWVEPLRRGVDYNIAHPGPDGRFYRGEGGAGRFMTDYCNWRRIPEYRDFAFDSPAARIGAKLMGSARVRLFHEHVLVKEAAADVATPWHHDLPYYCIEAPKSVSLWLPLDAVPRQRTPEFVAGSHRMGERFQPQRFNGNPLDEGDGLPPLPDIESNRQAYTILAWPLEPGDAVAFDFRTWHGAPANASPSEQRRAFSLRLVGEGAVWNRRDGMISSPPFPDIVLANGAPLAGEAFPMLPDGHDRRLPPRKSRIGLNE